MKVTGEDKVVTLSTTEHDEEEVNGDVEDDGSAEEGAGDTSGDNEDEGTPDDEDVVAEEAEKEGE